MVRKKTKQEDGSKVKRPTVRPRSNFRGAPNNIIGVNARRGTRTGSYVNSKYVRRKLVSGFIARALARNFAQVSTDMHKSSIRI